MFHQYLIQIPEAFNKLYINHRADLEKSVEELKKRNQELENEIRYINYQKSGRGQFLYIEQCFD